MLRITVHENPVVITFQLEGSLGGPWVHVMKECWQTVVARLRRPILRLDLTGVTSIDGAGKSCLAGLHRQGAEFIGTDCLTSAVVDEISQASLPDCLRPIGAGERQRKRNWGTT